MLIPVIVEPPGEAEVDYGVFSPAGGDPVQFVGCDHLTDATGMENIRGCEGQGCPVPEKLLFDPFSPVE